MHSSRTFIRVLGTSIASIGLVFAGVGVASAATHSGAAHVSHLSDSSQSHMSTQKRDSGW